jgi:hypothetical protein
VGIGLYRLTCTLLAGRGLRGHRLLPVPDPLGALLPRRLTICLPETKHRHHAYHERRLSAPPAEWNIGEAAGALAAFCLERGEPPGAVRDNDELLSAFQKTLERLGVPLRWPQAHPI